MRHCSSELCPPGKVEAGAERLCPLWAFPPHEAHCDREVHPMFMLPFQNGELSMGYECPSKDYISQHSLHVDRPCDYSHQWNADRVIFSWKRHLRSRCALSGLSSPICWQDALDSKALGSGEGATRWKEPGSLYHHVEESCLLAKNISVRLLGNEK